jgi:hypothetical protein
MDSISLLQVALGFIIPFVFLIMGASGLMSKEHHPIDAIWLFIAMGGWFAFSLIDIAFATSDMFVAYAYWYVALGLLSMMLGFYALFLNIHLSSGQKDINEMKLE